MSKTGKGHAPTQEEILLGYLMEDKSVSRGVALRRLGIANLPEIVRRLRKNGWPIDTNKTACINRYGEKTTYADYRLRETDNPRTVHEYAVAVALRCARERKAMEGKKNA